MKKIPPPPKFPAADYADEDDRVRAEQNRQNANMEETVKARAEMEMNAKMVEKMQRVTRDAGDLAAIVARIKAKQDEW